MRAFGCVVFIVLGLIVTASTAGYTYSQRDYTPSKIICSIEGYPTEYNELIYNAVLKHWPLDWKSNEELRCAYYSQLIQESSLNAETCERANKAGARCFAQILPATAKDIEQATGLINTRSNIKASIYAGAWYMAKLGSTFTEPRTPICRQELALACYHSGCGWVYKAQSRARENGHLAICYSGISPWFTVVGMSRSNSRATDNYIEKNRELRKEAIQ